MFLLPALSLISFMPCLLTDSSGSFFAARSPPRGTAGLDAELEVDSRSIDARGRRSRRRRAASRLRAATRPSSWSPCRLRSSFASASSGSSVQANQAAPISNSSKYGSFGFQKPFTWS